MKVADLLNEAKGIKVQVKDLHFARFHDTVSFASLRDIVVSYYVDLEKPYFMTTFNMQRPFGMSGEARDQLIALKELFDDLDYIGSFHVVNFTQNDDEVKNNLLAGPITLLSLDKEGTVGWLDNDGKYKVLGNAKKLSASGGIDFYPKDFI